MRFKEKGRTLVVAAHPDDEVLGCGGTIFRLAKEGEEVHLLFLGEGLRARQSRKSQADPEDLSKLQADARAVSKLLGVKSIAFEDLPDNRSDEVALLEIVKRVEKTLRRLRPKALFTHHPGDLNVDHRRAFEAVLTATRPVRGCSVKELYAFEVPSSTEWAFQQIQPVFKPNVFVDVTLGIHAKIRGMGLYKSETRRFPHPRSSEALRATARRWGSVVGVEYAEAFELIRWVR